MPPEPPRATSTRWWSSPGGLWLRRVAQLVDGRRTYEPHPDLFPNGFAGMMPADSIHGARMELGLHVMAGHGRVGAVVARPARGAQRRRRLLRDWSRTLSRPVTADARAPVAAPLRAAAARRPVCGRRGYPLPVAHRCQLHRLHPAPARPHRRELTKSHRCRASGELLRHVDSVIYAPDRTPRSLTRPAPTSPGRSPPPART